MHGSLSKAIYERLPWWMQNIACSLVGIGIERQRFSRTYRQAMAFLEESQWWALDRQVDYQNQKLRGMIQHAYETVPYYREVLDQRGVKPDDIRCADDLQKLPILDKDTIQVRFEDLLSRGWPKRRIVHGHTGGTTGKALRLAYDRDTPQWQWAIWYRHLQRFGVGRKDSKISFAGRGVVPLDRMSPPFWRRILFSNRTYVSIHHMTRQNMPALIDYLQRRKVKVYGGYPAALYLLASYVLENNIRLKHPPRIIVTGAETLVPYQRTAFEKAFGAETADQYGASEGCGNISECQEHRYHVDMEFGIIEFLPLDLPGSKQRRIICTGLQNPVMPLIRYDIGDLATMGEGPCPCGRQSPVVEQIDGRIESCIITPDGRQLSRLDFLFKDTANIKEAQLIQDDPDRLTVRLAVRKEFAEQDERELLTHMRQYVGDVIKIDPVYVESIPREPNGKFRQIVSSVFRDRVRETLTDTRPSDPSKKGAVQNETGTTESAKR